MTTSGVHWSRASASHGGAIGVVRLEGDLDAFWPALGIRPIGVGRIATRRLAGIDEVLVARPGATDALLFPHGGWGTMRAIEDHLRAIAPNGAPRESGPTSGRSSGPTSGFGSGSTRGPMSWPEASDDLDRAMLDLLRHARSPLAIDLLPRHLERLRRGVEPVEPPVASALGRLIDPPLVVVTGPSNVGKSTLVNALARRTVAVVADAPGTTLDHVGCEVDLDGLLVSLVDTAGIRATSDGAERDAIVRASALVERAAQVILCGDGSSPPVGRGDVRVALRVDLGRPEWEADVEVSVHGEVGVGALAGLIRERLVPTSALEATGAWDFRELARGAPSSSEIDPRDRAS